RAARGGGVGGLLVARALRVRGAGGATAPAESPPHWLDHTLEGALILAPLVAALVTLLAGYAALAAFATPTAVIDGAVRIVGALVLLRFGVYLLGLMLGPDSWLGTRENRITFVLWVIAAVALLGWLDVLEAALNRVSLVPGRTQLSLWGLLKGLVIVTAFLVMTSLIARASAGNFGWVQELRGRYVVVRDRDGVDTLVPNQNLITSPFINWSYSDQRVRLKLPVNVSYDDDPEVALKLLLQAAENHPRILHDPQPVSRLIS